jgi:lipopolysaccharide biosynthesis glycosyltransferase
LIQSHPQPALKIAQSRTAADPVVLCAADENYIRPLAVMLHSAAEQLADGKHLYVVLLDGGIKEESYVGLRESLFDLPISIDILKPNLSEVDDLMTSHHITHTAYLRLMAARLLPDDIEKVVYLDSDVLVKDDLSKLWDMDLNDNYCLAAIDIAVPFVDASEIHTPQANQAKPYLMAYTPIQNWKTLGLDGSANYFNSGVMVLNLKKWRDDSIEEALFRCLRENAQYVWCWDQYALNVVFAGQWGELPARWNQGGHIFEYPNEANSPIDQQQFVEARDNPAIIHYTTMFKPWDYRPFHPLRENFFAQLDQTAWKGWRPEYPGLKIRESWDLKTYQLYRFCCKWSRKFSLALKKPTNN